jgi:hypothetical protein
MAFIAGKALLGTGLAGYLADRIKARIAKFDLRGSAPYIDAEADAIVSYIDDEYGGGGGTPTLAAVLTAGNSAGTKKITNLVDPTAAQDAATKNYVDGATPATPGLGTVLGVSADAGAVEITNAGAATLGSSLCTFSQAAALASTGTGVNLTAFLADGWVWDNQGGSTLTQTGSSVTLYVPASTSLNIRHLILPVPTSAYMLTVRMRIFTLEAIYKSGCIGWKGATGASARLSIFQYDNRSGWGLRYFDMANQTSGGPEAAMMTDWYRTPLWMRITDTDGATPSVGTLTEQVSMDGQTWLTLRTINKATDYLSATGYNYLLLGGNAEHASQDTYVIIDAYELM